LAADGSLLTRRHLRSHISWYNTIGFVLPCGCAWITFWKHSHSLVYMCDVTHSYVWRGSLYGWRDSFIYVKWLAHMRGVTHSHVWSDSFTCDVTQLYVWRGVFMCNVMHSYMWHDACMCVMWRIHMCDGATSCMTTWRVCSVCVWMSHELHLACTSCMTTWRISMCDMTDSITSHVSQLTDHACVCEFCVYVGNKRRGGSEVQRKKET